MVTTQQRITVLPVDDHELARQGLRRMLELEDDLEVVGEASSVEEALERIAVLTPDIVLMDINMPLINGLEATRMLRDMGSHSRVIILSLHHEFLAQAFEAGAGGYLIKDMKREELVSAIRRVSKGEVVVASDLLASPDLMRQALTSFHDTIKRNALTNHPHTPAPQPAEAPSPPTRSHLLPEEADLPAAAPAPSAPTDAPPFPASPPPADPHMTNYASPQPTVDGYQTPPQGTGPRSEDAPPVSPDAGTAQGNDHTREPLDRGSRSSDYPETSSHPPQKREDEAELLLPPPLDFGKLMLISKKLREQYRVEIIETSGSWEGGTWMRLMLRTPVSLLEVLTDMPEVAQVWEPTAQDGEYLAIARPRSNKSNGDGPTPQLLIVKLAADAVQLALISD